MLRDCHSCRPNECAPWPGTSPNRYLKSEIKQNLWICSQSLNLKKTGRCWPGRGSEGSKFLLVRIHHVPSPSRFGIRENPRKMLQKWKHHLATIENNLFHESFGSVGGALQARENFVFSLNPRYFASQAYLQNPSEISDGVYSISPNEHRHILSQKESCEDCHLSNHFAYTSDGHKSRMITLNNTENIRWYRSTSER